MFITVHQKKTGKRELLNSDKITRIHEVASDANDGTTVIITLPDNEFLQVRETVQEIAVMLTRGGSKVMV
jgi:hypothetical protein